MTNRTVNEKLRRFLPKPGILAAWIVVAAAFVWFHWSSIWYLYDAWQTPDYGYGFAVPIFSVFLLWQRRDMALSCTGRGSWWGVPVLVLWILIRTASLYFNYGSLPEYSILVFFAGVAIFVGGWRGLQWAWPSIVFLVFMIPLPALVQGAASLQLQGIATRLSAFTIQTLGIPALAVGHQIQVSNASRPLDVESACSGLRMLMLFFAMCVGMAFVAKRELWEKIVLVVSAVPIAIVSNVVRIVLTAVICEIGRHWPSLINMDNAQEFIHDWVGLLVMMPFGLLLLLAEMTLLSKLLIQPLPESPLISMTGSEQRRG